jgi:TctA family transporter
MCVDLIIISCIDCVSIWYVFWMFISLKFLGFVIRKLYFLIMDSKIIHAVCMGAIVTYSYRDSYYWTRKKYNLYIKRTTYKCNWAILIAFWIEVIDIASSKFVWNQLYYIICVMFSQVVTYYNQLKMCLLESK